MAQGIHFDGCKNEEFTKDGIDMEEYSLRKRLPKKLPKRKNDVYVNRQTNCKAQYARCEKLLDSGAGEIYIHGLGAAVNRAINLALQLEKTSGGNLQVSASTSTVDVIDDLEPKKDHVEPKTQSRSVSAIHIRVKSMDMTVNASEDSTKGPTRKAKRSGGRKDEMKAAGVT